MNQELFGDYLITEDIGRGATSRVVRATKDSNEYAIKIFDTFASHLDIEYHRKEYSILQKLHHSNIVKVHDFGTIRGYSYIVMDLIIGENLAELVRHRGPLDISSVINIVRDISDALEYARQSSIIHGDIKPSNILVDKNGKAYLVDFGLAKIAPSLEHMTKVIEKRTTLGTTDFMAPEVLQDGPSTWSSDLYSLGIVTYFALTAHLPSDRQTVFSRAQDRVKGKIVPVSLRNRLVPTSIEKTVHRAIAIDPRDRFASSKEFYAALIVPQKQVSNLYEELVAKTRTYKIDFYRHILIPLLITMIGGVILEIFFNN